MPVTIAFLVAAFVYRDQEGARRPLVALALGTPFARNRVLMELTAEAPPRLWPIFHLNRSRETLKSRVWDH
jgi:hypothetical protein